MQVAPIPVHYALIPARTATRPVPGTKFPVIFARLQRRNRLYLRANSEYRANFQAQKPRKIPCS